MKIPLSGRLRYVALYGCLLASLVLLGTFASAVAIYGAAGHFAAIAVCFAAAATWFYLEPRVFTELLASREFKGELSGVRQMVTQLAHECGVRAPRVWVYESRTFGVRLKGLNRCSTVFVSSIAADLAPAVLRAVLAHELGHIKLNHPLYRFMLLATMLSLAMVGTEILLVVVLANVFVLWLLRRMELAADSAGARIVGVDCAKLALTLIRDMLGDTPRWQTIFSTHPTFRMRLERLH